MDRQTIGHIKTFFSSISDLPFHVQNSLEEALTGIDGGLRAHFHGSQLYEDLRILLSKELSPDVIVHLQDAFCLHYVFFLPDASDIAFCAIGPFVPEPIDNAGFFMFLQQSISLPVFSVDSVLSAARSILALISDTSARTIRDVQLHGDSALLVQLSVGSQYSTDPDMQRLIYYIQTHLHQKLTLQSLSEYLGFSSTYISHRFKEEIGQPPMQYILQQRLLHSQYLLRTSNTPIKEIADAVGIPDCSYFSKLFRENVGTSPSQYRNTYK